MVEINEPPIDAVLERAKKVYMATGRWMSKVTKDPPIGTILERAKEIYEKTGKWTEINIKLTEPPIDWVLEEIRDRYVETGWWCTKEESIIKQSQIPIFEESTGKQVKHTN